MLPPRCLPWQTPTSCDAPARSRPRPPGDFATSSLVRSLDIGLGQIHSPEIYRPRKRWELFATHVATAKEWCARSAMSNQMDHSATIRRKRTFSRRHRTRFRMREVAASHASVIVFEMSQQERAWPQHGRGRRTDGPHVRQATLSNATGPTHANGGRQNDASRRFPLKHQSSVLTGCISWTCLHRRCFAPPCFHFAGPKISAAKDGIVAINHRTSDRAGKSAVKALAASVVMVFSREESAWNWDEVPRLGGRSDSRSQVERKR